ncbi:MAG: hypothetical protein KH366_06300 [Clostridiaceae bacterium]|nr:hypothetical protein [Clostridiaceae bacterium]
MSGSKAVIIFKDKQFFVVGVGPQVIAPQTDQYAGQEENVRRFEQALKHFGGWSDAC